jgi:hypothetical protein
VTAGSSTSGVGVTQLRYTVVSAPRGLFRPFAAHMSKTLCVSSDVSDAQVLQSVHGATTSTARPIGHS